MKRKIDKYDPVVYPRLENGMGKRTDIDEYTVQHRGGLCNNNNQKYCYRQHLC